VDSVNPELVKSVFDMTTTSPGMKQFIPFIKERKIVQWGGMSDPFCNYERQFGIGLQILQHLSAINYPMSFSTKGSWWTKDTRYTDCFKGHKNWSLKISCTVLGEEKRQLVEPGCSSTMDRFAAMERMAKLGIGTICLRLRPFIIGLTNPDHKELIRLAALSGAKIINAEFLCLDSRCKPLRDILATKINPVAKYDMLKFYEKCSDSTGYMRLNWKIKKPFVEDMVEACDKYGVSLYMADNNCRGREIGLKKFYGVSDESYGAKCSRGQWVEALRICVEEKRPCTWNDIGQHLDYAKGFLYRVAEGFNTKGCEERGSFHNHTMKDWLQWHWNHPNSPKSPMGTFEGLLKPLDQDAEGNLRYILNQELVDKRARE